MTATSRPLRRLRPGLATVFLLITLGVVVGLPSTSGAAAGGSVSLVAYSTPKPAYAA